MPFRFIMLLLMLVVLLERSSAEAPEGWVATTSGRLLGKTVELPLGRIVQYLGVPYGQAPVGPLRFLPPRDLHLGESSKIYNATRYGAACVQPPHLREVMSPLLRPDMEEDIADEDCLTLNVFVPQTSSQNRPSRPVVVWLPGEGFDYASARQFDGSYLALLGDVIVVTVNYRVSVFGFLSTLTLDAPGNVGLLDQRLALKWVERNAVAFGGNPDSVTLMGRFTGAMSIAMHMVSSDRDANPLFQRAVLQSGVPVGKWVFDYDPLNATLTVAEKVGCHVGAGIPALVDCLRRVPAADLLDASRLVPQRWRPVLDGHFLTEEPLSAIRAGRHAAVDVVLGTNSDEGSLCLLTLFATRSKLYPKILKNDLSESDFDHLVQQDLQTFLPDDHDLLQEVTSHEYKFSAATDLRRKYLSFCSGMYVRSQVEQMARLLAENRRSSVYVFSFDHRPSFSTQPDFVRAAHGDDVLFGLGLVHQLVSLPHPEVMLSRRMIAAFSNFARKSDPNPLDAERCQAAWPEFTPSKRQILTFSTHMGPDCVTSSPNDKDVSFWQRVVPSLQGKRPSGAAKPHPSAAKLTQSGRRLQDDPLTGNESPKAGTADFLVGNLIGVQAAEYLILGMAAASFLLVSLSVLILGTHITTLRRRKCYAG